MTIAPELLRSGLFRNRREAGRLLAAKLAAYANRPDILVLALPRGGVPVAYEVARALGVPLDVFVVRKLGVPGYEEYAMGAVATGGTRVLNKEVVDGLNIPEHVIDAVAAREKHELTRRERQVCARAAIGMSIEGAALDLGIGSASVLTYRKRAYDRLGISSQNELFGIVLRLMASRSLN